MTDIHHQANNLLHHISIHGVPIELSTPNWTNDQRLAALLRGSHPSARAKQQFLRDELADMVAQRFWIVLPFELVRDLPSLRLSPMGVVPQRDRRDRVIVDYTFSHVNKDTQPLAPNSMQFGRAFDRLLHKIHHANRRFGPVYMSKADLADGFYRIPLRPADIPALAVAFPQYDHEPPLVALPMKLPMGWILSPPYFCAFTETAADLANKALRLHNTRPRPHHLSTIADNPTNASPPDQPSIPATWNRPPLTPHVATTPLAYVDIYVDDFLALAQGDANTLDHVRSTLYHAIDTIFRPLHPDDLPFQRKEPISEKKLHKGDGLWETRKVILGWIIDTQRETIELPPHRLARLHDILTDLCRKRRISLKSWQQNIGELQSMLLALPGGRGLFSTLYTCFADHATTTKRVRLIRPIHDALIDLQVLAQDLHARPTRIGEIVDTIPVAYGTADASGLGMGGVWLSPDPDFLPFIWRSPFPPKVQAQLWTDSNPTGTITNSDLELASQIAAQDILLQHCDCREHTISVFTDNMSARAWQRKGARATLGPAAYLLRLLSLHQRHFRYRSTFDYLPGPLNVMADDASRLLHYSDTELLTHFNNTYPQTTPWQLFTLRPEMLSSLITALYCRRSDPASYLPDLNRVTRRGFNGPSIVASWASLRAARTSGIHYYSSKCLPTVTAQAASHPVVTLSDLVPWKGPSAPWDRRWPCWGPQTPDSTNTDNPITFSNNNYVVTTDKIPLLLE